MTQTRHRYSVYGLQLASDAALPELEDRPTPAPASDSLDVRLEATGEDVEVTTWLSSSPWARCGKNERGYVLQYVGAAEFRVDRAGREVRCTRVEPGTSPETLRHLLLDHVLPLVLDLLGHDVLHATAILTPAGVCAFVGESGAGKSTLAASFAAAGFPPFCDDCLVVRHGAEVLATPGYGGVRLRDDVLSAMEHGLARVADVAPRPLAAVYRVTRETDLDVARVEPIIGSEAFVELASSAFVLDTADRGVVLRHFRFVDELATRVRVGRLCVPDDLSRLPSARRAVLDDLGGRNP